MKWIMIMMTSILAGCMTTYEMAQEASFRSFCPEFGRLSVVRYPVNGDRGRMYVKTISGKVIEVESHRAQYAHLINRYEEYTTFLDLYTEVCGGYPPWIGDLRFFSEKLMDVKRISGQYRKANDQFRKTMMSFPDFDSMRPDVRRLRDLRAQIRRAESELSSLDIETFYIAGEIQTLRPEYAKVYGSAMGSKGTIIYNEHFIVNKYRDADVKHRKYFAGERYFAISLFSPYGFSGEPKEGPNGAQARQLVKTIHELKASESALQDKLSEKAEAIRSARRDYLRAKEIADQLLVHVARLDHNKNISVLEPFLEVRSDDEHTRSMVQCLEDADCRELTER